MIGARTKGATITQRKKALLVLGRERVRKGCTEEAIFELGQVGKLFQAGRSVSGKARTRLVYWGSLR